MKVDPTTRSRAHGLARGIEQEIRSLENARTMALRGLSRDAAKRLRGESAELVVALAFELLALGRRLVAFELIAAHGRALESLDIAQVEMLAGELDSWYSVDMFCVCIAGPCWREGQISDQDIARWAGSENPWWRRAALVATTALTVRSRGGYGDSDRTLVVARMLVDDRHHAVVRALSRALRELIPWEPDRVAAFLEKHWDSLATQVRREVRNKLDTALKKLPIL